jgi:hypothetical protein
MKFLLKSIIVILIFLAGFYFGQNQAGAPTFDWGKLINSGTQQEERASVTDVNSKEIKVNLMLDFGNGQIKTFNQISLMKGASVFDLLKKITTENDLDLKTKDYGQELGVLIEKIGAVSNDAKTNYFWTYWVNNNYAEIGASNYHLKDQDIIEWKYTKSQY